jgi:hypothetical protein
VALEASFRAQSCRFYGAFICLVHGFDINMAGPSG